MVEIFSFSGSLFYTSHTITLRLGISKINSVSALGLQFILIYKIGII